MVIFKIIYHIILDIIGAYIGFKIGVWLAEKLPMKKIAIKNKIIKWLGGYTQDELIEKKTITITRTEKQLIPIKANFAAKTNYFSEHIRSNLCYQIAEYILNFNLCYYNIEYDSQTDCYIYKAVVYVREP